MERQCKYARHISIYLEKNDSLDEDKLPKFPSSFEMWRPTLNTGTAHQCFLDIFKAYPILQSNMRRTRLWTHSWKFGIISESSYLENASVPNEYDPEVIQSILCEMFVYSSAEHHDKSNDKLSDSEFNIIFCQAVLFFTINCIHYVQILGWVLSPAAYFCSVTPHSTQRKLLITPKGQTRIYRATA